MTAGDDSGGQEVHLGVSQYPGGFYLFWVVLVPLSVLINIRRFGLRKHEIGLLVALQLSPSVLEIVLKNVFLNLLVSLVLVIWIESILARWYWYRIYSTSFLRNIGSLVVFLAVPSFLLSAVWSLLFCRLPSLLRYLVPSWGLREASKVCDGVLLMVALTFLVLSIGQLIMRTTGSDKKSTLCKKSMAKTCLQKQRVVARKNKHM